MEKWLREEDFIPPKIPGDECGNCWRNWNCIVEVVVKCCSLPPAAFKSSLLIVNIFGCCFLLNSSGHK